MNSDFQFDHGSHGQVFVRGMVEDRASRSRSKHEGESSSSLCDRLSRTRDLSQRQLPTYQDYAVSTREYQTDQSSPKPAPAAAAPVLDQRQKQRQQQKQPHRCAQVDGSLHIRDVLEQARIHGVGLRMVPEMYDSVALNSSIEYIGQFPTIPLHRGHVPEVRLLLKRGLDVVFSSMVLILVSPLFLVIAIAIKLDSHGPVFYAAERVGKKGRVFRCVKFRTMVSDAEQRRVDLMHRNERDGVLFKIANDPRITKLGRFLRKHSLDEFPQFFNVQCGDMSVVGPRPPLRSEVRAYELSHLRRLAVTPGITGLWQVHARQEPSFDSYITMDTIYIENWSIWLDLRIILRTFGVVLAGTGT